MAAPAPVKPEKPLHLWERKYDPDKIAGRIERTVKDIQDTRIKQVTFYVFAVLKGLAFIAGSIGILGLGILVAVKLTPMGLSPLASIASLIAFLAFFRFCFKWMMDTETPKCLTNLEGKLDKLFNKIFVADKGKLTPEHLTLLQKHAIEIRNPTVDRYLHDFIIGADTKKIVETLTNLYPETRDVVQEGLQQFVQPRISYNLFHSLRSEIIRAKANMDKTPAEKEIILNLLKQRLYIDIKVSQENEKFIVDEQDAAQILKCMTKRRKLSVYTASDEIFKSMQDLPLTKLDIFGVDYTSEKAALVPRTLKDLLWHVYKKDIDLKPLASRCPDLEKIEGINIPSEDRKLFKKLKTA